MELAVGIVGVAVALIFGVLAYLQQRPGQKIAEDELRDQPPLEVLLYGTDAETIVWILDWPKGQVVLADFEISLTNHRKHSIEDIILKIDISSLTYAPELDRHHDDATRLFKMERATSPIDGTERVELYFSIPIIHPKATHIIRDEIFFPFSNRMNREVDVKSKDGVDMKVSYTMFTNWTVDISAGYRDSQPVLKSFTVSSLPPTDELVSGIDEVRSVFSTLAKNNWTPGSRATGKALALKVSELEVIPAPDDMVVDGYLRRVRLKNAERVNATYFEGIGFLPVEIGPDGSMRLDPRLAHETPGRAHKGGRRGDIPLRSEG